MPDVSFNSLAVVLAVAFVAPLLLGLAPRLRLPSVVLEIVLTVFFVTSGIRFDLDALRDHPITLARVPIFLAALVVVRGIPAVIGYRRFVGTRGSVAAGLLQATSLPFIVTATQIGVAIGAITKANAAAFVAAGLLSALLFPFFALVVLRGEPKRPPMRVDADAGQPVSAMAGVPVA